jgi:hypothetical protein
MTSSPAVGLTRRLTAELADTEDGGQFPAAASAVETRDGPRPITPVEHAGLPISGYSAEGQLPRSYYRA